MKSVHCWLSSFFACCAIAQYSLAQPVPLIEVDFNDAAGNQSLSNRGSIPVTGVMSGDTAAFSEDVPFVNSGGWSGSFHSELGELEFIGTDQVSFGDLNELDGMPEFTLAAWVKSPEFHQNGSRMFSKAHGGAGFEFNMIGGTTPAFDGVPAYGIDDPTSTNTAFVSAASEISELGGRLPRNQWGFVAASYDSDAAPFEHVTWYLGDGTTLNTTQENFPINSATGSSNLPLLIGNYRFEGRVFKGLIDNVRIYDQVLTFEEVLAVMQFDDAAGGTVLVGDYNGDGAVNAADYTVWRETLGSTEDLRANGDDTGASAGIIDQADYNAWTANYGLSAGSGALSRSVPEPAAITLLCGFACAVLLADVRDRRGRCEVRKCFA